MVTMVGRSDNFKTTITDLIVLEYDAIEAYKAAILRLESDNYKNKLREFLGDHNLHVNLLSELAVAYDIELPKEPDAKQILTKGKVVLADLLGDKAILAAMKTNEDDTVTAYKRALEHDHVPEDVKHQLERGLMDEKRHRQWMIDAAKDSDSRIAA